MAVVHRSAVRTPRSSQPLLVASVQRQQQQKQPLHKPSTNNTTSTISSNTPPKKMLVSIPVAVLVTVSVLFLARTYFWSDSASSFPPASPSEWLDDINTQVPPLCGFAKCLFASKSNGGDGDSASYGYLVSQVHANGHLVGANQRPTPDHHQSIQKGYDLAQQLSRGLGAHHLYRGPPQTLAVGPDVLRSLRQAHESTQTRFPPVPRSVEAKLVVQPLALAPGTAYEFRCHAPAKMEGLAKEAVAKLRAVDAASAQALQAELRSFEERLQRELNATHALVRSPAGGCLIDDFQVLIDARTGDFYHLDHDRCFARDDTQPLPQWDHPATGCGTSLERHAAVLRDLRKNQTLARLEASSSQLS